MLKDKTALVTGSTSGIGPGIAHGLAAQGANVILHGFGDPAAMVRLKDELAERLASGAATTAQTCAGPKRSRP